MFKESAKSIEREEYVLEEGANRNENDQWVFK